MQDKELYSLLLGVKEPWKVSDVNIDLAGLKVDIYIGMAERSSSAMS